MSAFESLAADYLAPTLSEFVSETVTFTTRDNGAITCKAQVNRGILRTRQADNNQRLEHDVEVWVEKALFKDSGGNVVTPVIGADTVSTKRRASDAAASVMRITAFLPDGQHGARWGFAVG